MSDPDEDDDALRWEGDEELGRSTSLDHRPSARVRATATGGPVADLGDVPARDGIADAPRDIPLTVATALLGIVLLAETVGWILVVQGLGAAFATGTGVIDFLGGIARFLALLAAPLWFVAAFRLTSRRATRLGWLALGAGVLVPWPLLLGVIR